jgi:small ligand-binding sensory domain FIST
MRFIESLSTERDSLKALDEVCTAVSDSFPDRPPDLAFLFLSAEHVDAARKIVPAVRARVGPRHLAGCTGESIIGSGREIEGAPGLSLWAASLPGADLRDVRVACEQTPDGFCFPVGPPDPFEDLGENASLILVGEPFTMPADNYLRRFNEDHPGVPVVGGMASGARAPGENLLLLGDRIYRDGAVGVLVGGAVRLRTVVSQGCRPVGKPCVVTACDRNAILKLGGKSALQTIQETYATMTLEDRQLFQRAPHVGVVLNERQHSFGPGDFLIRNVVGIDPDHGAVFVSDYLRRGQTIQFHVRDGRAASEDLSTLLAAEKSRHRDGDPRGGLIFSCNGRGTRLFENPDHDITAVRDSLGDIPVSGFFAQGEMGPVGSRNHLHGFTTCLALFSSSDA